MKEIEILVKVLESKKSALKKLDAKRFRQHGIIHIIDTYFYDPARKNLQPCRNGDFTECFRIRQKTKEKENRSAKGKDAYGTGSTGRKTESFITYKVDVFEKKGRDNGKWLYADEHETSVSDAQTAEAIIKSLGMKTLVVVDNTRAVFTTDDYEIVLEDVKDLGLFLEVERIKATGKSPQQVRKEIFNFIDSLGIRVSGEVTAGKAGLLYNLQHNL